MSVSPTGRATRRVASGPGLRPTLIDLYLLRLLASRTAAGFAVIFTVTMLERALRIATQMAAAGAHLKFLPAMIWNLAPHYVALATPDAFLIGILLTVSRLDEDLEIEAMLASGFSLGRIVWSLVLMGFAAAALNLLFIGYLEPLGLYGYRALRERAVEAGWTAEAQPWAFQSRGGEVTLTADDTDASGRLLAHVFIHRRTPRGGESVLTAAVGRLGLGPDGRTATLRLGPGLAYLQRPGHRPMAGTFGAYSLTDPYPTQVLPPVRGDRPQELTLDELATAPGGASATAPSSELFARLARTLSIPMLPFLALPMAVAAKRERRGVGMALAGMLALTFREVVRLTQRMGAVGRVDPLLATFVILALFAALVGWIFVTNRRLQGDTPLAVVVRRLQAFIGRFGRPARADPSAHATVAGYVRGVVGRSILTSMAALVGLLVMIDLFERTEDILEQGFGWLGLLRHALLRAPILAEQSIGLATVVGAAFAFLRLSRSSEMLAVRALGVSLFQIARMCLPIGLALVALSAVLAETAAPAAQLALARWWNAPSIGDAAPPAHWFRVGGDLVMARAAASDGARLSDVIIFRRRTDGTLSERTAALAATYDGRSWRLTGASIVRIGHSDVSASAAGELPWNTTMRPADVVSLFARPMQISARAALRALAGEAPTELSRGYLMTRLNRAAAEPAAPLIMLLLALPLALSPAQAGPSFRWILWVLGAGLVYVVVDGAFTAAGQTGMAPPWLAAWFAPALFLSLAATAFVGREA